MRNLKKVESKEDLQKRVVRFLVPGCPIPCVRTTQKQKYVSTQYKRYQIYQQVVRTSYLLFLLDLGLQLPAELTRMGIISSRAWLIASRDSALKMINTSKMEASCFMTVEIEQL